MHTVELSPDQKKVRDAILDFVGDSNSIKKFITIGGYAGTGKTTVIGEVMRELDTKRVAFCAYTGKAASVLASKLDNFSYCGTIHSLIYRPLTDEKGRIIGWDSQNRELYEEFDLIVIDEASMVNEEIFKDLLEYGLPIICVGDHGQLPPVKSKFNLMEKPMFKLEKVHRQAEANPIIKLSMMARLEGAIPFGEFGEGVKKVRGLEHLNGVELNETLLLCGTNKLRQKLNAQARTGVSELVQVGEKVICLKNNRKKGIYNGMVGFVEEVANAGVDQLALTVNMGDGLTVSTKALKVQFGNPKTLHDWRGRFGEKPEDLFDYAYAMSVWKAQGSEADSVVFIEEALPFLSNDDYRRFMYTAITRSKKELMIIKP